MIGQKPLIKQIDKWSETSAPRFVVLTGTTGSGKKTLTNYMISKLNYLHIPCGIKIEEIRKISELARSQNYSTLYSFFDADSMSVPAKNSMLKLVEEPPRNSYFVMTISDLSKTLPTIKSRAQVIPLVPYTKKELYEYIATLSLKLKQSIIDEVISYCEIPGQLNTIFSYEVEEFVEYVDRVVMDLGVSPLYNALKVASKLKTYGDSGWEIPLFLRAVQNRCLKEYLESKDMRYYLAMRVCVYYINQSQMLGINKQFLVDSWITDIRKCLKGEK